MTHSMSPDHGPDVSCRDATMCLDPHRSCHPVSILVVLWYYSRVLYVLLHTIPIPCIVYVWQYTGVTGSVTAGVWIPPPDSRPDLRITGPETARVYRPSDHLTTWCTDPQHVYTPSVYWYSGTLLLEYSMYYSSHSLCLV